MLWFSRGQEVQDRVASILTQSLQSAHSVRSTKLQRWSPILQLWSLRLRRLITMRYVLGFNLMASYPIYVSFGFALCVIAAAKYI